MLLLLFIFYIILLNQIRFNWLSNFFYFFKNPIISYYCFFFPVKTIYSLLRHRAGTNLVSLLKALGFPLIPDLHSPLKICCSVKWETLHISLQVTSSFFLKFEVCKFVASAFFSLMGCLKMWSMLVGFVVLVSGR